MTAKILSLTQLAKYIYPVSALSVTSDDQSLFAASSIDKKLICYSLRDGAEKYQLQSSHIQDISQILLAPDDKKLMTASFDHTIKTWDLDQKIEIQTLHGHLKAISSIDLLSERTQLISGSYDNSLKIWDLEVGNQISTLVGHTQWVNSVRVIPNTSYAISVSGDMLVQVWNLDKKKTVITLRGHMEPVNLISVSSHTKKLLTASWNYVNVWNLGNYKLEFTLQHHASLVTGVVLIDEDKFAISVSRDGKIVLWDPLVGTPIAEVQTPYPLITCVALSNPSQPQVIAADNQGTLFLIEL